MSYWKAAPGLQVQWRHWDDEYVMYECGSGDTHVLNALGAATIKRLVNQPYPFSGLVSVLADDLHYEIDDALSEYVLEVLKELLYLRLVEKVAD